MKKKIKTSAIGNKVANGTTQTTRLLFLIKNKKGRLKNNNY